MAKTRKLVPWQSIPSLVSGMANVPVYRNVIAPDAFPREFAKVKVRGPFSQGPAENELVWTAAVISEFSEQISGYIPLRDDFNAQLTKGDFEKAHLSLSLIEQTFGYSLWQISARLSLIHVTEGVKAQKLYLEEIMQSTDLGAVTAYLSYFFSYSLEEGIVAADVRREFTLDETGLVGNFMRYFRYHVVPFDLHLVDDPIAMIVLEESSPIIDRFETFVEMAQLLCTTGLYTDALSASIQLLGSIDDIRLKNLQFYLGLSDAATDISPAISSTIEAYTEGDQLSAQRLLQEVGAPNAAPWLYELAARAAASPQISQTPPHINDRAVSAIREFLDVLDDRDQVVAALHKLAFATRKSPSARAIGAILDRSVDTTVLQDPTANERAWFTGIPMLLPHAFGAHAAISADVAARLEVHHAQKVPTTLSSNLQLAAVRGRAADLREEPAKPLPASRAALYQSYAHFNAHDYDLAEASLRAHSAAMDHMILPRTLAYQYKLYRHLDEPAHALAAFASAYLNNHRAVSLYPLAEFVEWAIENADVDGAAIDRSLLLHAFSQTSGPTYDGALSDACEDVLDYYNATSPHDITAIDIPHDKLVYFLRHIATVERLEDTIQFDDVDAIERERILILQWLIDADPTNRAVYTQEITAITKDQEVARLTAQFERSKIYVHEDGIRRKIKSELEGAFERYRQVLSEPILGHSLDAIEQRFRKILREDASMAFIVIPSMERYALFHALVQQIFDLLVLDPSHGFKTYLSTRILHGVFEGELRASFVNENLLAAADSDTPQAEFDSMWRRRLGAPPSQAFSALTTAGVRFSSKVQDAISDLKDSKVRVWNREEYPNGIFAVSLSDREFDHLQASVTPTTQFQEFVDRVVAAFWESLDDCLREVVLEINGPFAKKVRTAFDQFEATLSSAELAPFSGELKDALARCRSSFAHDLARVSAWFNREGAVPDEPFSLPVAVQVATLITNNCHPKRPLRPDITCPHLMLIGEALNPIVDLLTNCLQNAAEHSNFAGCAPDVQIVASEVAAGLQISVTSSFSTDVDLEKCRAEVAQLVLEQDAANPLAVAREGKTGIRKMKRILRHDLRTHEPLDICVTDDRLITYKFLVPRDYVDENRTH